MTLDHRIHAVRRDVADVSLSDRVISPHYARPLDYGCVATTAPIRSAPAEAAVAVSEILLGETFAMLDCSGDWGWGFSRYDGYVGYVPLAAIGPTIEASHVVTSPAALLFTDADIKSPVLARLPMGARVAAREEEAFARTDRGFVHLRHVSRIDAPAADPLSIAERLIGVPYRWGGRSGDGIDCSGLVQLAHALCGFALPRDSDQQRAAFGEPVAPGTPLERGDLIFLPGHVALVADAETVVHANAHWMATVREPIADMLARQPEPDLAAVRRRPT